jgi:hypothetical protein
LGYFPSHRVAFLGYSVWNAFNEPPAVDAGRLFSETVRTAEKLEAEAVEFDQL